MRKKKLNKAQIGTALKPITAENVSDFFSLFSIPQKAITKLITGKYQTPSEAMGIKNKAGAIATDMILDPINLAGAGAIKATGAYKNAYRYNPWAFKANPEAYYHRSPNLQNIIDRENNVLQGFGKSEAGKAYSAEKNYFPGTRLNLNKPANNQLYFSKEVPLDYGRYNSPSKGMSGQGYEGPYLVEVTNVPMGASVKGRRPSIKPPVGKESYATSHRPISVDEAKFYKEDWLRGYKEVKPSKKKENGGWLDKYEAPKAQNGIEGTMGGLTDKGFNYNGAWGGTMQMGGSLPGAVGFTYARVGAPSKGPRRNQTDVTDASAQNGMEMKYYQEGLDFKPKTISQDGTYVKSPRTDMLTMDEYRLQQALANQPVIKQSSGPQLTQDQIFAKNKQYAEAQGKTFNPKTGAVTPFLSPSIARTFERASENIVEPMMDIELAMSVAPVLGKGVKAAGNYIKQEARTLDKKLNKVIDDLDNKYITPIQFKKQIADIKKEHALASERYNSPQVAERMKHVLGINPKDIDQPNLTFNSNEGSYYSSLNNAINMDLRQVDRLLKTETTSPRAVYEHEYGHFLQRESHRQSEDFANELIKYEENLLKYNDPENQKKLADINTWLSKSKLKDVTFNPGLKPQPYSNPTVIDMYANKVYNVDPVSRQFDYIPKNKESVDNANYFINRDVEQTAHLREMRQNMLEKGYLKNLYDPISEETVSKFIKENPRDRIASFTGLDETDRIKGLEKIFRNLPAVVPAVGIGAAATIDKKKKGGDIKKDDMGYWNPENWGEPVEIDSNQITMEGVPYPVLGISDTGDTQMMYPEEEYEFDGESVTEYPVMQKGGRVPVYTENPRDLRLKAYQDSLKLHNLSLKIANRPNGDISYGRKPEGKFNKNFTAADAMEYLYPVTPDEIAMSKLSNKSKILPTRHYPGEAGGVHFKKPVQPVEYRKPQVDQFGLTKEDYIEAHKSKPVLTPGNKKGDAYYELKKNGEIYKVYTKSGGNNWVDLPEREFNKLYPITNKTPVKPKSKKEEPAKPQPKPQETKKPEPRPQNVYEGSPVYSPGTGSGLPSALIGFANQQGDTTYIKPEDYERFAVPKYGKEFIESKKKQRNGGVNSADAQPIKKLDQLLNFTNYNKPTKGGWLDKY